MPARTGHTTYVPGRGATTVKTKKSGKQVKTFQGSPSKAPAGTKVIPESTAATAPTVEVKPSGKVVTRNYRRQAAEAEIRRAQRSRQRVDKIVSIAKSHEQAPKSIPVAVHARSLPGPTTKKIVPVKEHARPLPKATEVKNDYSVPVSQDPKIKVAMRENAEAFAREQGKAPAAPKLKGTPQQRKAARARVQETKKALKGARGSDGSVEGEIGATLVNHGFNRKGAAGVIGNAKQESSLSTTANDGAGNGGLFGFTAGEVSLPSMQAYAASKGKDWTNPRTQTNFMLEHLAPGTREAMNHAASPQEAAVIFQNSFEKPGIPMQENREAYAAEAASSHAFGKSNPKAVANYKAAVKEAKELGLKVSPRGINVGKPTKQVVTKFRQIKHAAAELESKGFPYSWGGGHDPNFSPGGEGENGGPGYDCSGAVSFVLHQAGVLKEPLTSGSMGSVLEPGPGAVTVFYNAEHTFMKIGNEYWGTSVGDSGAGGIGKHPAPSASYLAQYSVGHVPGLGKKQALQLGFKPGSLTSTGGSAAAFPGMTFSEGGTTATINPGAATEKQKAGPSKRPIKVDPQKQARQTLHKLKSLGAGLGEAREAEPTRASGLSALERKYGKAAV